jgi:hypothetical protein
MVPDKVTYEDLFTKPGGLSKESKETNEKSDEMKYEKRPAPSPAKPVIQNNKAANKKSIGGMKDISSFFQKK